MFVMALLAAPLPIGLMAWFFVVAPVFAKMFEDFGGSLPLLTWIAIQRWWSVAMPAGYLVALPLPLLARRTIVRDFALVIVVTTGLMLVMASAATLYLPVFQLAP